LGLNELAGQVLPDDAQYIHASPHLNNEQERVYVLGQFLVKFNMGGYAGKLVT